MHMSPPSLAYSVALQVGRQRSENTGRHSLKQNVHGTEEGKSKDYSIGPGTDYSKL
jgi:hypothetical protein